MRDLNKDTTLVKKSRKRRRKSQALARLEPMTSCTVELLLPEYGKHSVHRRCLFQPVNVVRLWASIFSTHDYYIHANTKDFLE